MKKATRKNKGLVVNMLSKAFDSNQSVDYIILQDKNREQRISGANGLFIRAVLHTPRQTFHLR